MLDSKEDESLSLYYMIKHEYHKSIQHCMDKCNFAHPSENFVMAIILA